MPGDDLHTAADLLLAIEAEMRRVALWESLPPPPEALASSVPFCHDTLEFAQWLQWVFLPRMRVLVEAGGPLPARCGIAPLAEHTFAGLVLETAALLALIEDFDRLIEQGDA